MTRLQKLDAAVGRRTRASSGWLTPPFLIRADGALAGFVLIHRGSQVSGAADVWDVAELFVLRGYRRRGVGVRAAHAAWRALAGRWEVRLQERNLAALAFWRRAVGELTRLPVEPTLVDVAGRQWHVFGFVSGGPASR